MTWPRAGSGPPWPGRRTIALTHCDGRFGALDNHCPHQGGPLGEGSIENGLLRCPWHGYDYDPITGRPPAGFSDAPESFPVDVREDGVYVGDPARSPSTDGTSPTSWWRPWWPGGSPTCSAWSATRTWASPMPCDGPRSGGELTYIGIRHEGAAAFAASAYGKLTGRPAACFAIAGPGSTNLLTGLYDAKVDRAPVLAISGQVPSKVLGRGAFQDLNLIGAFADVADFSQTILPDSDHAELTALALKTRSSSAGSPTWCFPTRSRCSRRRTALRRPAGTGRRPGDRPAGRRAGPGRARRSRGRGGR